MLVLRAFSFEERGDHGAGARAALRLLGAAVVHATPFNPLLSVKGTYHMSKVMSFTGEHLGHAATVVESEVTLDSLQAILDAAVITAKADSDGLYISASGARPFMLVTCHDHRRFEGSIRNRSCQSPQRDADPWASTDINPFWIQ
jgi:hypothetical protein